MKYKETRALLEEIRHILETHGTSFVDNQGEYISDLSADCANQFWDTFHLFEEFSNEVLETLWVEEMKKIPEAQEVIFSLGKMSPYGQQTAIRKFIEEFQKEDKS